MGNKEAKEKGVYNGRKQTVNVAKIRELASEGLMKTEIARRHSDVAEPRGGVRGVIPDKQKY